VGARSWGKKESRSRNRAGKHGKKKRGKGFQRKEAGFRYKHAEGGGSRHLRKEGNFYRSRGRGGWEKSNKGGKGGEKAEWKMKKQTSKPIRKEGGLYLERENNPAYEGLIGGEKRGAVPETTKGGKKRDAHELMVVNARYWGGVSKSIAKGYPDNKGERKSSGREDLMAEKS